MTKSYIKDGEIDLIDLFKFVWSKRKKIFIIAFSFAFLGLIFALTSPNKYKASTTLILESGSIDASFSGFGSLANLANLNGAEEGNNINPELYQEIVYSTPFLLGLMDESYFFPSLERECSVGLYLSEFKKGNLVVNGLLFPVKSLLGVIKSDDDSSLKELYVDSSLLNLSYKEISILENLKNAISITVDPDLFVVKIEVELQDPYVAAKIVHYTREYLTEYITEYSLSKFQNQLMYIEDQYSERKIEFQNSQIDLANYTDRNKFISTAVAQSELERLKADFNLAFSIYNQIAQQREQVKLKIEEETPVFTTLEPIIVPLDKSSPNTAIMLIVSLILGFFFGLVFVLVRD